MATPTPMKHAPSQQARTPSQHGRTPSQIHAATPPVSTPFSNAVHAALSPYGPRSSPQQMKKSPANSANLGGHPSNGPLNFDSPSTAAAMRALDVGTSFDLGLENVGGLGPLGAFAGETDKLKRLDEIMSCLDKQGLVSEASLARLAQRLGLELLSEEQTAANGRKTRTLVIAGSAIALDIVLDNNMVQNISLAFHDSPPSVARHADAASRVLLKDLKLRANQSPLTKSLDQFAANFERLATLDKLSISPGLDCQEALAGIFVSLERLYDWDLTKLREQPGMRAKSDEFCAQMVMCTKHGRPAMHASDRVGLALQYWKEYRFFPPKGRQMTCYSDKRERTWSLLVSCAAIDSMGLPPVRVSENWISKEIVKEDPSTDPKIEVLDWQEPDNVMLPSSEENKDCSMDMLQPDLSTARVPRVTFTVTLDPPVILPQTEWMRLYAYAGVDPPSVNGLHDFGHGQGQLLSTPLTFDSLFFPIQPGTRYDPSEVRTVSCSRRVHLFGEHREPVVKAHRNSLFIYKPVYSQEATELPFSHPRQLMAMLPLLRQYALLSTLLERSFCPMTRKARAEKAVPDKAEFQTTASPPGVTTDEELARFMRAAANGSGSGSGSSSKKPDVQYQNRDRQDQAEAQAGSPDLNLDVILWVHPMPHLQVVFPLRSTTANVGIRIVEGGTVEITDENVLSPGGQPGDAASKKRKPTRDQLASVLEHLEDLDKWAEWIRSWVEEEEEEEEEGKAEEKEGKQQVEEKAGST